MSEIVLSKNNYDEVVAKSDVPVLIDFWASWCGPCQMLGPVVAELAEESEGKFKVCKCDVDDNPELAQQFTVFSIPALFVVKDGKVVDSAVGFMPKERLKAFVEKYV